jgi:hypothetical protein
LKLEEKPAEETAASVFVADTAVERLAKRCMANASDENRLGSSGGNLGRIHHRRYGANSSRDHQQITNDSDHYCSFGETNCTLPRQCDWLELKERQKLQADV